MAVAPTGDTLRGGDSFLGASIDAGEVLRVVATLWKCSSVPDELLQKGGVFVQKGALFN